MELDFSAVEMSYLLYHIKITGEDSAIIRTLEEIWDNPQVFNLRRGILTNPLERPFEIPFPTDGKTWFLNEDGFFVEGIKEECVRYPNDLEFYMILPVLNSSYVKNNKPYPWYEILVMATQRKEFHRVTLITRGTEVACFGTIG